MEVTKKQLVDRQLQLTRKLDSALQTGEGRIFIAGRIEQISEILEWLEEKP